MKWQERSWKIFNLNINHTTNILWPLSRWEIHLKTNCLSFLTLVPRKNAILFFKMKSRINGSSFRYWNVHIRLYQMPWHSFKSLVIIVTDEDDVEYKTTVNIYRKRKSTVTFEAKRGKKYEHQPETIRQTVTSSVDTSLTKWNCTRNLQCPKMSRHENEFQQWSGPLKISE